MKRRNLTIGAIILIIIALIFFIVSRNSKQGTDNRSLQQDSIQKSQKEGQGNTDLTKKNIEFRTNWYKYIMVSPLGYQPYHPEGIKDWTLTVSNTTEYKLDYVRVEISYILANGRVYKTKPFVFRDVNPKSIKTEKIPETEKAITIKQEIKEMKAGSLNFCYDYDYDALINKNGKFASAGGISGNPADPWKCK